MFGQIRRMCQASGAGAWRTSLRSALVGAVAIVAFAGPIASSAKAAERVVIATSPVGAETNLFWQTLGAFIYPSLQTLVGNDSVTGAYDNSQLAERWEHNDDFTSWAFYLRPEARFSDDWGPVTADDVVHSFKLHIGEDSKAAGITALREVKATAVDAHTVRFDLPSPQPEFLFSHAGRGALVIYSKAQFDAEGLDGYKRQPAGSGLFRYESAEIGQSILFSSVKDHWSGIEVPFDELEFRWVSEPSTRLAMLISGEAHAVTLPPDLQATAVKNGHKILTSSQGAQQSTLIFMGPFMNDSNAEQDRDATGFPWADLRVREAMNRALDRDAMLEVLYGEGARKLSVFTMDPRYAGYTAELDERFDAEYGYDSDRARELLAEAGYPDNFDDPKVPIIITTLAGSPEFAQLAELVQAYFEQVGIQTEMREKDWSSAFGTVRGLTADFVLPMRNAPVRPSALGVQIYFTTNISPWLSVGDEELDRLGEALIQETDPTERGDILSKMFTRMFETYMHMPIATVLAKVVVNSELVEDWTFPGATSTGLGHYELIRLK